MDNSEGRFNKIEACDYDEISHDPVKKEKLFKQGEILKIKESYFVIRSINFTGIMTLKLLPDNQETHRKFELQNIFE